MSISFSNEKQGKSEKLISVRVVNLYLAHDQHFLNFCKIYFLANTFLWKNISFGESFVIAYDFISLNSLSIHWGFSCHQFLDNLFKVTSDLVDNKSVLKSGKLQTSRKLNLNHKFQENSAITSLEFHPTAKIAYTASLSRRLAIFQVSSFILIGKFWLFEKLHCLLFLYSLIYTYLQMSVTGCARKNVTKFHTLF